MLYRNSVRVHYLKTENKRQNPYDEHMKKVGDSFKNGDLFGISLNRVDRTNCDPKIMLCIVHKRFNNGNNIAYSLTCPYGCITSSFPIQQLRPVSCTSLRNYKIWILKLFQLIMSLIQASKMLARVNTTAPYDRRTKCVRNVCSCWRVSATCSTKCHSKVG